MKGKKIIFLFLALLLPGFIFLFLKIFGKNQFDVPALFQTEAPALPSNCGATSLPFVVPSNELKGFVKPADSLAIIFFSPDSIAKGDMKKTIDRLVNIYKSDPVAIHTSWMAPESARHYDCIFAMKKPNDVVVVDNRGLIRGQYESSDRDEIDRLKTEITIILKRY